MEDAGKTRLDESMLKLQRIASEIDALLRILNYEESLIMSRLRTHKNEANDLNRAFSLSRSLDEMKLKIAHFRDHHTVEIEGYPHPHGNKAREKLNELIEKIPHRLLKVKEDLKKLDKYKRHFNRQF